jgi:hypothetical protein
MITSMTATGRNYFIFVSRTYVICLQLMVCAAERLVQKWDTAKADLGTTENAFNELTASLEPEWIAEWGRDEAKAMLERGKAMEIYDVAVGKGMNALQHSYTG